MDKQEMIDKLKDKLKCEELEVRYVYSNFYNDEKVFIVQDVYELLDNIIKEETKWTKDNFHFMLDNL